jgi:hypothetical protein
MSHNSLMQAINCSSFAFLESRLSSAFVCFLCGASSRTPVYIKMNRRSLVSLKLKNGLTDLNVYFFILFALLQGWFKKKKKSEKLPGKLENSGKTESAFFCGNGWNDLANFFFLMFVIIRMRFLCKEKLEKLPGKLENSGKTESAFL